MGPNVLGANLVRILMIAGLFGQQLLAALYLQRVLGFGPIGVDLATLPTALAIGVFSLCLSARLVGRFGARATLLPAPALVAAGLTLLARAPVDGDYPSDVLAAPLLLGAGAGPSMLSLPTIAMPGAAPGDARLASSLTNTTQQVVAALGVTVLATLSTARTESLLGSGGSTTSALTGGWARKRSLRFVQVDDSLGRQLASSKRCRPLREDQATAVRLSRRYWTVERSCSLASA